MQALLVAWLAKWAASPLITTHVLSNWNMVFAEMPGMEPVDNMKLPFPFPVPTPLLSVVPSHVSDADKASQVEAYEASEAEMDDNSDVS